MHEPEGGEGMKPIIDYVVWIFPVTLVSLLLFGLGLIAWTRLFGVPCWAFDGGVINDTITREIIERCNI